ncbi:uncharacterized protein TNIN_106321 [Trichonephila inaurata madagascariensis]|uniref:Uncharacterized protein n=1 Tax=Trichonephila inaurata madagascariensis TaxID=2747483 RepID=A0A8X6X3R3_9ARAC|nr:uncharacterized protein TNIN_106321 [Trichonephila inaurata madagascariensis]
MCRDKVKKKGKGVVNAAINNLPFEMHLPGHQSTGPGIQLLKGKTRLNPDLTYKEWSKSINRVDKAAYEHDVCYLKIKDTKTRNEVCDSNMIQELDDIPNPTIRERLDRAVVKPIIKAKKTFGMGSKMHCFKCKTHTDTKDAYHATSKYGRPMMKGIFAWIVVQRKAIFFIFEGVTEKGCPQKVYYDPETGFCGMAG